MALDYGKAATGTLGGGLTGAQIGSLFAPGVGTAIGGGLGALIGGAGGLFSGSAAPGKNNQISQSLLGQPARTEQQSMYTPEIQNQLNDQIMQLLQGKGQSPFEQQTMKQFHSQIVPSITEKFLGSGQERNTGSLPATLGAAGAGLAQDLQSQRQNSLLQLLNAGKQETNLYKSQPGLIDNLIPALTELGKAYFQSQGQNKETDKIESIIAELKKMSGQSDDTPESTNTFERSYAEKAPISLSPQDSALQKLIDSLIEKNTPQSPSFTQAAPYESNPNFYQLGGKAVPANQQGNITNLLLQALAANRPGGLKLQPNI